MEQPTTAPVLSTPADHIFDYVEPTPPSSTPVSDQDLSTIYEIARTANEIRASNHQRIALQFPDHMLTDAPRIVTLLQNEFAGSKPTTTSTALKSETFEEEEKGNVVASATRIPRLYILADTSYSACCVDEIAAEHADADVVVHYGRSCLSPTAKLPVIYVFTHHELDLEAAANAFEAAIPKKDAKAVVMADVTYQNHVPRLCEMLRGRGYVNLLGTELVHDPAARIPNRRIVDEEGKTLVFGDVDEEAGETDRPDASDAARPPSLKTYQVFHISTPPTALLLALSSRIAKIHIHPTSSQPSTPRNTTALLGRRYAHVLTLSIARIIGILINTLSHTSSLATISHLRQQIAAAGKKSYTVVVGKLNAAKLSNFAEIDGWVVVGCWESSLVETEGLWRPVVTPFELGVALVGDERRVWDGEWWSGMEGVMVGEKGGRVGEKVVEEEKGEENEMVDVEQDISDDEDLPPEFDLRTGKLVSRSRPVRRVPASSSPAANTSQIPTTTITSTEETQTTHTTLTKRSKQELASINGVLSPGAEFLRSQRTWQGLGSDFHEEADTTITEGRSGVARGYVVGEETEKT